MQHQRDRDVDYLVLIRGVGLDPMVFCCPLLTAPAIRYPLCWGANCSPAKMKVGSFEIWQGGWQSIAGLSDVPMEPNAARSGSRSAQHENWSTLGRHRCM